MLPDSIILSKRSFYRYCSSNSYTLTTGHWSLISNTHSPPLPLPIGQSYRELVNTTLILVLTKVSKVSKVSKYPQRLQYISDIFIQLAPCQILCPAYSNPVRRLKLHVVTSNNTQIFIPICSAMKLDTTIRKTLTPFPVNPYILPYSQW